MDLNIVDSAIIIMDGFMVSRLLLEKKEDFTFMADYNFAIVHWHYYSLNIDVVENQLLSCTCSMVKGFSVDRYLNHDN